MAMNRHFVNDAEELVLAGLSAIPQLNPAVALDRDNKVIYRKDSESNKVSIISGGGAGHEPSFVGFVGSGILNAAVSGSIFASPSPSQIFNAIMNRVPIKNGVLLIIMNYTGDVLNFGLGSEKAQAAGVDVKMVVVGDDVGVGRKKSGKVGRRGIAGTVLVHKIVGALADQGGTLEECVKLAELVSSNLVSVGCSLAHVHVPGRESSEDSLKHNEVELGMGIHNEQGSARIEQPSLQVLVGKLLTQLLDSKDEDRAFLGEVSSDVEWVLLVNDLGGLSPLELSGVVAEVTGSLRKNYSIEPKRIYAGNFMTSLNGLGFSITLLRVKETGLGEGKSFIDLLDWQQQTLGWSSGVSPAFKHTDENCFGDTKVSSAEEVTSNIKLDVNTFKQVLTDALRKVISEESKITSYDEVVGDGDCGITLKKGAEAVIRFLNEKLSDDAVRTVSGIAKVIEDHMDGTSGAIYSIFVNAFAKSLNQNSANATNLTAKDWSAAASSAFESLRKYTPAQPGDRTLIDALQPFIQTLAKTGDVRKAAEAAKTGAESTRGMKASLGRSVYVSNVGDVPDPGAVGVSVFVQGLADAI